MTPRPRTDLERAVELGRLLEQCYAESELAAKQCLRENEIHIDTERKICARKVSVMEALRRDEKAAFDKAYSEALSEIDRLENPPWWAHPGLWLGVGVGVGVIGTAGLVILTR